MIRDIATTLAYVTLIRGSRMYSNDSSNLHMRSSINRRNSFSVPAFLLRLCGGLCVLLGGCIFISQSDPAYQKYVGGVTWTLIGFLAIRGSLIGATLTGIAGLFVICIGIYLTIHPPHQVSLLGTWQGRVFYLLVGVLFFSASIQAFFQRKRLRWI